MIYAVVGIFHKVKTNMVSQSVLSCVSCKSYLVIIQNKRYNDWFTKAHMTEWLAHCQAAYASKISGGQVGNKMSQILNPFHPNPRVKRDQKGKNQLTTDILALDEM